MDLLTYSVFAIPLWVAQFALYFYLRSARRMRESLIAKCAGSFLAVGSAGFALRLAGENPFAQVIFWFFLLCTARHSNLFRYDSERKLSRHSLRTPVLNTYQLSGIRSYDHLVRLDHEISRSILVVLISVDINDSLLCPYLDGDWRIGIVYNRIYFCAPCSRWIIRRIKRR